MTQTDSHFSPVAIIEIDKQDSILAINPAAIQLLNLSDKLPAKFNYRQHFGLSASIALEDLESITIVIHRQNYFLQVFVETERTIFVVQPINYLKSRLAISRVPIENSFDCFASKSKAMQNLIAQAKAFSRQKEPLLISGETGTGKDVLAQACHNYSFRGDKIFLAINCAALPDEVVESELYGHAPGAYPGVTEGKKGFFEQANGGSVLLDGIDEMSSRMQTKLLRFINDGTFRRVGDDNEVKVDVRVICATKADLSSLVKQGLFREDLYYRLNVLPLHIPALRERQDDIMPLTQFFVAEFANKQGIVAPKIGEDVATLLLKYPWPGNVRQLKNVLYSTLAQLNKKELTAKDIHLPELMNSGQNLFELANTLSDQGLDEMVKQFEKTILAKLYLEFPSTRKLSKRLGISHTAVANKLRDYGISK